MTETEVRGVEAILTLLEEGSHYGTDAQHKLYFIGEMSGESFGHVAHLYGPHSSMVSNQLEALVAAGLVEENVSDQPLEYGPRYPKWYRLSDDGKAANAARPESLARFGDHVRSVSRSGALADTVAVAARAHQRASHRSGLQVSATAARKAIGEIGLSHISDRTVNEAVEYLRSVGLVVEALDTEGAG